jgi:hypothetical protein
MEVLVTRYLILSCTIPLFLVPTTLSRSRRRQSPSCETEVQDRERAASDASAAGLAVEIQDRRHVSP